MLRFVCSFVRYFSTAGSVSVPADRGKRLTRQLTRSERESDHRSKRLAANRHANGTNFHSKMTFPGLLPA